MFPTQLDVTSMVTIMSNLSVVSLLLALGALAYIHGFKGERLSFHAHMTVVLLSVDLVDSLAMVASTHTYSHPWACELQSFAFTVCEVVIIFWNGFMAFNLYAWVVRKKETALLVKRLNPALIVFVAYAVTNATLFRVFYSASGPADLFCWFPDSHKLGRVLAVHVYLYPAMAYIAWVLFSVYHKVIRRKHREVSTRQALLRLRVGRRFLGYLVAFVATWLFPMINRLLQLARGHSYPWLMALHALSKPSMGFFDSLVYGSVWAAVAHRRQFAADKAAHLANERRKEEASDDDDQDECSDEEMGRGRSLMLMPSEESKHDSGGPPRAPLRSPHFHRNYSTSSLQRHALRRSGLRIEGGSPLPEFTLPQHDPTDRPSPRSYASIFVTTLNCANLSPAELDMCEDTLRAWIPHGHDLYVVGLQEVRCLSRFRALLHEYLGGDAEYVMFKQDIAVVGGTLGGGVGGSIALVVFGRTIDVESGALEMTSGLLKDGQQVLQGMNLGLWRAGNKGGVGLPFRFHGSSIAFMTAHLPAEGSRGSRVDKRNAALQDLFRDVCLAGEPFDLHLTYHHTILLGDLNYRLSGPPEEVLSLIAKGAKASVELLAKSQQRMPCSHSSSRNLWAQATAPEDPEAQLAEGAGTIKEKDCEGSEVRPVSTPPHLQKTMRKNNSSSSLNNTLPFISRQQSHSSYVPGSPRSARSDTNDAELAGHRSWLDSRYTAMQAYGLRGKPVPLQWSDLLRSRDELTHAMSSGLVLHNFSEGPIGFPPSYRRERGLRGDCGDYTDERRLRTAYSTRICSSSVTSPAHGKPAAYPIFFASGTKVGGTVELAASMVDLEKGRATDLEMGPASPPRGFGEGTSALSNSPGIKIRVPSYTDRILYHSLEDMRPLLSLQAYEMCEAITASDHRAVSAVFRLDLTATADMHRRTLRRYHRRSSTKPSSSAYSSASSDGNTSDPPTSQGQQRPSSTSTHSDGNNNPMTSAGGHSSVATDVEHDLIAGIPKDAILIITVRLSSMRLDLLPTADKSRHSSPARPLPVKRSASVNSSSSSSSLPPLETHASASLFRRALTTLSLRRWSSYASASSSSPCAGPMESGKPARLALAFPLPCENGMDRADRALEYIHSAIGHSYATWSREGKNLLKNVAYADYDAAVKDGVTMAAAVKMQGVLHGLIKLIDAQGNDLAQGVLPLPGPGRRKRRVNVSIPLSLHGAARGTLTCGVEISDVKVKVGKDWQNKAEADT